MVLDLGFTSHFKIVLGPAHGLTPNTRAASTSVLDLSPEVSVLQEWFASQKEALVERNHLKLVSYYLDTNYTNDDAKTTIGARFCITAAELSFYAKKFL